MHINKKYKYIYAHLHDDCSHFSENKKKTSVHQGIKKYLYNMNITLSNCDYTSVTN